MRPPRGARAGALLLLLAIAETACGGTTEPASADPSLAITAPPPSAAAPSATGSAVASPSPTARPSVAAGGPVVELAIATMAKEPFVSAVEIHSTQTATTDTTSAELTTTTRGQIAGRDFRLKTTGMSGGIDLESELVVVGESVYASQHGGPWQRSTRAQVSFAIDPILRSVRSLPDADVLGDLGEETLDGSTVHHVTLVRSYEYEDATGSKITYLAFDLWVLADGTPILRKDSLSSVKGSLVATGSSEIHYTSFGLPVTIVPPELPATPAPSKRPARP